ncbi:MAG: tyrosine-type recombinase/integrase [Acidimicrobiales bacterium]
MSLALVQPNPEDDREVLEFEGGVRAYSPAAPGGYWRLRWEEAGRRRDTTAASRDDAVAKAADLVERMGRGTPTELARATGTDLVAHYLDPGRRPARVEQWSERHRDEQVRYCNLYVAPLIGTIACARLTRLDFQRVLDQARTRSVATQLRRCLTAMVNAGLVEGHLMARQDVLRGVRWQTSEQTSRCQEPTDGLRDEPDDHLDDRLGDDPDDQAITQTEIPTTEMVHALGRAAAEHQGVWWRELEILFVAYTGLRWGEHVALRANRIDARRRRVNVDRQVIEVRSGLKLSLPKSRRRRVTMFPATTPGGVDLAGMVGRRLKEVGPDGLLFPSPHGQWARRSNYGRNLFDPAAATVGWPRRADGHWAWKFHSLRHVFATWALTQPGLRIEDVSRLMGHSSVRVTQDIYIHVHGDVYDRFYQATE